MAVDIHFDYIVFEKKNQKYMPSHIDNCVENKYALRISNKLLPSEFIQKIIHYFDVHFVSKLWGISMHIICCIND